MREDQMSLEAPSFAMVLGDTQCWKCGSLTPVAGVLVPSYTQKDEEFPDELETGEASLLQYIEAISPNVVEALRSVAPWLKEGYTSTADTRYLINHCTTCDVVQGDYFAFGVDGPFWPQTDDEIAAIRVVRGAGTLKASASTSSAWWMEKLSAILAAE